MSIFDYTVYEGKPGEWVYDIWDNNHKELIVESKEWFDSKSRATLAAIGHISLLENEGG